VAHLKSFGLNSFDDQGGEQIDHQTDDGAVEEAQKKAAQAVSEGDQRSAAILRSAIATADTPATLDSLQESNKKWLKAMPEATKAYFDDGFKNRRKELDAADFEGE
jgi:hypothetical protein